MLEVLVPDIERMASLILAQPGYFLMHWWSTFSVSIFASILSTIAALGLAVLGLRYTIVERVFSPIVAMSQSFPLQAIAPLILIAVGTGFHSKLLIAFLIALFPIYSATTNSLKSTPSVFRSYLKVTQASFIDGVMLVRLPIALPAIVGATKVGFTLAVLGAVVAEFIQPDSGIGRIIMLAHSQYDSDIIYISVLMLMAQGMTVFGILNLLEKSLLKKRWEGT